jgi:hypothetical protein
VVSFQKQKEKRKTKTEKKEKEERQRRNDDTKKRKKERKKKKTGKECLVETRVNTKNQIMNTKFYFCSDMCICTGYTLH